MYSSTQVCNSLLIQTSACFTKIYSLIFHSYHDHFAVKSLSFLSLHLTLLFPHLCLFLPSFPFLLLQNHSSTEQDNEQEDPDVEVEISHMSEDMARDFNTHAYLHSASYSTISNFPLIEQYSNSKCNQYCRSAFLIFKQIHIIDVP